MWNDILSYVIAKFRLGKNPCINNLEEGMEINHYN